MAKNTKTITMQTDEALLAYIAKLEKVCQKAGGLVPITLFKNEYAELQKAREDVQFCLGYHCDNLKAFSETARAFRSRRDAA